MANRQTYTSQAKHTRILFQPLIWGCELECLSTYSPMTQVYSTAAGEYIPDREECPTTVRPTLYITDPDGIIATTTGSDVLNSLLSSDYHQWWVNGEKIEDVWEEGTDYEIATASNDYLDWGDAAYNGTLCVYKNLRVLEGVTLYYTGMFCDTRTNFNQAVRSNTEGLTTVEGGTPVYALMIDEPIICYNPLKDNLLLYDYLVGIGETPDFTQTEAKDGNQYYRSIGVYVTISGEKQYEMPDGYSIAIVDRETGEDATGEDYVLGWDYPYFKIDLRLMGDTDLEVQLSDGENIIARKSIQVIYSMPKVEDVIAVNHQDLVSTADTWDNKAIINLKRKSVEYPEMCFDIRWYTQNRVLDGSSYTYGDETLQAIGEEVSVDVDNIGIGTTANDCWFVSRVEVEDRGALSILTDDDGEALTDDDGKILIG